MKKGLKGQNWKLLEKNSKEATAIENEENTWIDK